MEKRSKPADIDLGATSENVNVNDAFAKTVGMRVVELSPGCAKADEA